MTRRHKLPPLPDPRRKPTMTVREAAPYFGCGVSTLYASVAAGDVPSIRLGHRVVIPTAQMWTLFGLTVDETEATAS